MNTPETDFNLLPFVIIALFSGLVGGLVMNALMNLLSRKGATPVNMVSAIGSLLSRESHNAKTVGTIVHLANGFLFGLIYLWLLNFTTGIRLPFAPLVGAGIGLMHGVVASFSLMYIIRDTHPSKRHRSDSVNITVGPVYIAGHAAYGLTVGLVASLLAIPFGL